MRMKFLKLKWQMWERILEVTGWLFGTDHEAYFGVKANRNKAFFAYRFPSRRKAK